MIIPQNRITTVKSQGSFFKKTLLSKLEVGKPILGSFPPPFMILGTQNDSLDSCSDAVDSSMALSFLFLPPQPISPVISLLVGDGLGGLE